MCIYRRASPVGAGGGGLTATWPSLRVLLVLVTVSPAFTGQSLISAQEVIEAYQQYSPHFGSEQHTDMIAVMGQPVLLPCVVYNLTDKLVSWIRTRDLNILTHGTATFTADPRFDIQHQYETNSWTLKIKPTRLTDTGRYECQVNTDPKMSLFFNLKVQEHASPTLKAQLSGPKEQYVAEGSTVTFVCEVTSEGHAEGTKAFRPGRAANVHWLHNGLAVSFKASRGGISIDTTRSDQGISSRLTVGDVSAADDGRYTCGAGDAADSLYMHVRHGEHMEAMQRDEASSGAERSSECEMLLTLYAALVLAAASRFV